MNEKILSIVIPSYNTSSFIDKNMQFFLDEKLYSDVEILLINDGSKDDTLEKIEYYQANYPGYVRLIDKENGGHGSVINKGIEEAKGKYFKVIDGDDWVVTENLILLVDYLKSVDDDLIINPLYTVDELTGVKKLIKTYNGIIERKTYFLDDVLRKNIVENRIHSITIKTDLLRVNNIRVTEKCFYEDFQYAYFPVVYVGSISFMKEPVYCYLIGQQNQSVSDQSALKNIEMLFKIFSDSIAFYNSRKNQMSDVKRIYIYNAILGLGKNIYNVFLRNYKEDRIIELFNEYDEKIKKVSINTYKNISKKYAYIGSLRLNNKIIFYFWAKLLKLYKKLN